MLDRTGHRVPLMYLLLLVDLKATGQYSWGFTVLAHLYRKMCNDYTNKDISGCLTLLHMWAWDHFPMLAPAMPPYPDPRLHIYLILPPLGFKY